MDRTPDPVTLVRPIQKAQRWPVHNPSTDVAYRLCLCQPGFAAAQRFLGPLALNELTNLAADSSQHLEQLLIGLPFENTLQGSCHWFIMDVLRATRPSPTPSLKASARRSAACARTVASQPTFATKSAIRRHPGSLSDSGNRFPVHNRLR